MRWVMFFLTLMLFMSNVAQAQLIQNLMIGNAKALSLGNAVTADPPGVDSIHFNPAGLARLKGRQSHLKFILGHASIEGRFSTNPIYNELVGNLPTNADGTLVSPDIAADSDSEIKSFAVYLPGGGITELPVIAAPLGGVSINPLGSKMTFATAIYAPMLLGLTRSENDPGKHSGRGMGFTRLTFFSPSIGYQVTDTLAVGASIGFSYVGVGMDVALRAPHFAVGAGESILNTFCGGGAFKDVVDEIVDLCKGGISTFGTIIDIKVDVEKAVSTTFNFGVLWDVTPWLTWGIAYQSEANDTIMGNASLQFSPEIVGFYQGLAAGDNALDLEALVSGLGFPLSGRAIETKTELKLVMPQHISTGISLMLLPRLKVNVDVKWTETSKWESLRVEFDKSIELFNLLDAAGISGVEKNALELPRGYEDTINWGIGLEYTYSDNLKLRLGYEPRKTGIPDGKLDLLIPLGDADLYAAGFSYAVDKTSTFDVALGYVTGHQKIPAGSSSNVNSYTGDTFIYNPYAALDVETKLEVVLLELSYQSHF